MAARTSHPRKPANDDGAEKQWKQCVEPESHCDVAIQQRMGGASETTTGAPQSSARKERARWQVRSGGSGVVEGEVSSRAHDACPTRNRCGGREIHVTHIRQQ